MFAFGLIIQAIVPKRELMAEAEVVATQAAAAAVPQMVCLVISP